MMPANKTSRPTRPPELQIHSLPVPSGGPGAADEHRDDQVVRQREQPPLHEHEPPRERLGVSTSSRAG